jgi:hypothetical protein
MTQRSEHEVQELFRLADDNTGLAGFFDAVDAMPTLCRAVEPLTVEVQQLRRQTVIDAQNVARMAAQLRAQDADLAAARGEVMALKDRLAHPAA